MKTKRLFIRELVPDDWKAMKRISEDFRRSEYAIYDMPLPIEDEEIIELTKQLAASHLFFAVMLEDAFIGYICFHDDNGIYDLGFCFHSDYHGQGYAFEGCSAVMAHIAEERGVRTFTAGTSLLNIPSCKLLAKLGFVLKETEMLSFHKDENGNDITFEGGIFVKNE